MSPPPWLLSLDQIEAGHRPLVGGKALALSRLRREGFPVPDAVVLTASAYERFVAGNGLRERIALELGRKAFEDMRWEEVWDTALRIRHLFLSHPIPSAVAEPLKRKVEERFRNAPLVVRSSAPEEDGTRSSFAGLHESFVNVRGVSDVLDRVRQVWASLWSDAALLYRQELGLLVETSAMAVVIQDLVAGDRSGVAFSRNPVDENQAVVEAVHGLNQGLVDGTVEPDRWIFDRSNGRWVAHQPAGRRRAMVAHPGGVRLEDLPGQMAGAPPLDIDEARQVIDVCLELEKTHGHAVDMEWTFRGRQLVLLQVRPITAGSGGHGKDQRPWYLSLRRSFDSLRVLRTRIESEFIPEMTSVAEKMAAVDLGELENRELATEIERRAEINAHWSQVYWRDFIPMAHGARLFGQVYNDRVKPDSPFEFVSLLAETGLKSMERNRKLQGMAEKMGNLPDPETLLIRQGVDALPPEILSELDALVASYGGIFGSGASPSLRSERELLTGLLLELVRSSGESDRGRDSRPDPGLLKSRYLEAFPEEELSFAEALLDLARASYRLRDDDNIFLGRIEAQLNAGLKEARIRLAGTLTETDRDILEAALGGVADPAGASGTDKTSTAREVHARQLIGQPAGPGIARGPARVIENPDDLYGFKAGEVLVCDAVDPNMTFVVPLAAAVVERRGGMLIHGAIIAREYGLPCVTGVPEATRFIRTGDPLTVDGYLGIVILDRPATAAEG